MIRPITNCNCLFLNKKIATIDSIAEIINAIGIDFNNVESCWNKSKVKTLSFKVFHKSNTNIKPPETREAINKYMVCIL